MHASFAVPDTAALGFYSVRVASGEHEAVGGFEVQEYRRPEFEVIVSAANRFVVQGGEAVATVQARYYFGQPVANARVRYVVNQQAYYSPLRWTDAAEDEGESQYWYGDDQTVQGELRLDAQGRGEIRVPLAVQEHGRDYSARIEAQVTDASSRQVSGNTIVHATVGTFMLSTQVNGYLFRPSQSINVSARAIDYVGTPQPDKRLAFVLERVTYPDGRYSDPVRAEVGRTAGDHCRRRHGNGHDVAGAEPGTYVASAHRQRPAIARCDPRAGSGSPDHRSAQPKKAIAISS